jgi:hypothetical protein
MVSDELPNPTPKSPGLNSKLLPDMEAAIRAGEVQKDRGRFAGQKQKSRLGNVL